MRVNLYFGVISFCFSTAAFAHGGGEAAIEVGPEKGVVEVTSDKSFKLSPEASKKLGIKSIPFSGGEMTAPKSSLVMTLKEYQVFRVRSGFIKAIHLGAPKRTDKTVSIQSSDLRSGDEIVVEGGGFLRIIAAQLGENESEDESAHGQEKDEHDHSSEGKKHHD